ncbi:MAG: response regulator [Bacteroidota bacterium]
MKYKILYVDDEEINLRIFKNSFRRDFEVSVAKSGEEALKLLENELVDVVITDQRMPKMTGVELLGIIHEKYHTIPPNRLILSGYAENEDIQKAFKEYRLFKFIAKPWEYNELKAIILDAINLD